MAELAPSILSADFCRLGEQVGIVEQEGVRYLHIDVMDGMFVPSISFGFPVIRSLRPASSLIFDVHLMIEDPIRYIKEFADAGSDIITVHYEACQDLAGALRLIRSCGCRCGVSVNPGTPVSVLYPYLTMIDMVLIMTVEPGFGGQKYIESMTEKIRELNCYLRKHSMENILIEADGGIHQGNIQMVIEAGVRLAVCGSAVFRGDIRSNVRVLLEKIREPEVKHE